MIFDKKKTPQCTGSTDIKSDVQNVQNIAWINKHETATYCVQICTFGLRLVLGFTLGLPTTSFGLARHGPDPHLINKAQNDFHDNSSSVQGGQHT